MSTNPRFTQAIAGDKTHCIAFGDFLHFGKLLKSRWPQYLLWHFFLRFFRTIFFPQVSCHPDAESEAIIVLSLAALGALANLTLMSLIMIRWRYKVTLCHSATKIYLSYLSHFATLNMAHLIFHTSMLAWTICTFNNRKDF